MKAYYVEWADIKADCQYDHDNDGSIYGIHYEDDDGQIVDAVWFKTEVERADAMPVSNHYIYRGHHIRKTDFGMWEVYGIDSFQQFDTVEGLEAFVDSLEVH